MAMAMKAPADPPKTDTWSTSIPPLFCRGLSPNVGNLCVSVCRIHRKHLIRVGAFRQKWNCVQPRLQDRASLGRQSVIDGENNPASRGVFVRQINKSSLFIAASKKASTMNDDQSRSPSS